jgi:hypothetical protein
MVRLAMGRWAVSARRGGARPAGRGHRRIRVFDCVRCQAAIQFMRIPRPARPCQAFLAMRERHLAREPGRRSGPCRRRPGAAWGRGQHPRRGAGGTGPRHRGQRPRCHAASGRVESPADAHAARAGVQAGGDAGRAGRAERMTVAMARRPPRLLRVIRGSSLAATAQHAGDAGAVRPPWGHLRSAASSLLMRACTPWPARTSLLINALYQIHSNSHIDTQLTADVNHVRRRVSAHGASACSPCPQQANREAAATRELVPRHGALPAYIKRARARWASHAAGTSTL